MSRDHAHLAPSATALLDCSDTERLEAIQEDRWITYPRARLALEVLEMLLTRPRTTRMTSIAIYADSGMGKTMLMERFKRAHPPAYNARDRRVIAPVLALQMASHATERRFYGQLLTSIGVPFTPRAGVMDLEVQVLRNLQRMEVKVLMLDEVHNILAGNAREQRIILNTLRYLSNELKISLVCLGISEAREAIGGDVQLARRFEELFLPRWQGDEEFQNLVLAVLRHLPLRTASQISARALRHVLQVTDGVTARVFRLFSDLAVDAIASGAETITDESITAWRPDDPFNTRLCLKSPRPWCLPLPFVIEPFPDELLSSWLRRTGQEYGVSLEQLARHIKLSKTRPTDIDHHLSPDDVARLAGVMRVERTDIRQHLLHPLRSPAQSLRSSRAPIQNCATCSARHRSARASVVALRAWFEFWSIECQACGGPMSSLGRPVLDRCNPAREHPNWYSGILPAARRGAARLHAFARRPFGSTLSPIAILGLLSKPRAPGTRDEAAAWHIPYRVADLFVPGLSELTRDVGILIPDIWTAKKPLRLVTARTILFAGLAYFLDDPVASIRRVREAMPFWPGSHLDCWIVASPPHTRASLA